MVIAFYDVEARLAVVAAKRENVANYLDLLVVEGGAAEGALVVVHLSDELPLVELDVVALARLQEGVGRRVVAAQNVDVALQVQHAVLLAVLVHRVS